MPTYVAYSVYVCDCDSASAFWPGLAAGEELWLWPTFRTGSHVAAATCCTCSCSCHKRRIDAPVSETTDLSRSRVYVCVCSGRKSENNCMKTRDGSLKEARTANATSLDERQTKRGRQQAAHTHTHTLLHSSCCKLNEFNWKTAGRSRSQVRRVLGSPANRIIPFVCTLMEQLKHLCCQDKVQLTQA